LAAQPNGGNLATVGPPPNADQSTEASTDCRLRGVRDLSRAGCWASRISSACQRSTSPSQKALSLAFRAPMARRRHSSARRRNNSMVTFPLRTDRPQPRARSNVNCARQYVNIYGVDKEMFCLVLPLLKDGRDLLRCYLVTNPLLARFRAATHRSSHSPCIRTLTRWGHTKKEMAPPIGASRNSHTNPRNR
jgi:hypothetical protein